MAHLCCAVLLLEHIGFNAVPCRASHVVQRTACKPAEQQKPAFSVAGITRRAATWTTAAAAASWAAGPQRQQASRAACSGAGFTYSSASHTTTSDHEKRQLTERGGEGEEAGHREPGGLAGALPPRVARQLAGCSPKEQWTWSACLGRQQHGQLW